VKRTVSRLLDLGFAVALSLTLANVAQLRAFDGPRIRQSNTPRPEAPIKEPPPSAHIAGEGDVLNLVAKSD